MENTYFEPRVHFIAGKGGVGKTTLSQGLARLFADRGHRTLLIELMEEEDSLQNAQIGPIRPIGNNFYCLRIYPEQALYEYLVLKIPSKRILDILVGQQLFNRLCSAMPGLSDLTRLGKIWFHADSSLENKSEIFDKVVVDMPSSGFVPRFLSIARVVAKAVKFGPMAKEARRIDQFLVDPKNACIHFVALAKELVVNETLELFQAISAQKSVSIGVIFLNRLLKFPAQDLEKSDINLLKNYTEHQKVYNYFHNRFLEEQKAKKDLASRLDQIKIIPAYEFARENLENKWDFFHDL